jgi:hypothetical protein
VNDTVIISTNLKALEEASQELDTTAQEIGLTNHQEKTKYLRVSTKTDIHSKKIGIGGYRFERVSSFPDVGSIINDDNSISEEITHRIKKGNRTYYAHKGLMTSKLINRYTKGKISIILIRPAMTYACVIWTLSVRNTIIY